MPVEVNGVDLSFVLDTGVSKPILFNLVNTDSLQIKNVETIFLRGLGGDGSIEALRSKHNLFKVGDAINVNQDVYVVFDSAINFTPRLGVPVHGIIGYDIFKDLVVEINYSSKYIRLHQPDKFKYKTSKKWVTVPLVMHNRKPYLDANVSTSNGMTTPVRLLIDSGGSDSLWLFEDDSLGLHPLKDKQFHDFLGKGLSGSVYGKRSKVERFTLSSFSLQDVNVAFPDSSSLNIARNYKDRNGSIAGNMLKRFNAFFDYRNRKLQLKKNNRFKEPFYYNNSGVVVEQRGVRVVKEQIRKNKFDIYKSAQDDGAQNIDISINYQYSLKPAYQIVEIRETSNAKEAGLMVGDVIVSINNKAVHPMSLQEINAILYDREGKLIRMKIERDDVLKSFQFRLDNVFKKKSPQKEDSNTVTFN
ncbi:MAG: aspartyl protease family protein [Bacteroidota bacterium]